MKRHVRTALRLVIAAAGVGFIIWSLTWADRLRLPAGYELPTGAVLTEPIDAELLTDASAISRGEPVTVLLPPDALETGPIVIEPTAIGAGPRDVRYMPGVARTLGQADWSLLALGLLLVAAVPIGQTLRWWLLMRCRGLDPGFIKALRLSLAGLFFNFSMPGMTGGDLVKAYYAARNSHDRGAAVMSVVVDRVTGLTGLILLAALAGLLAAAWLNHPLIARLTAIVWLALAVVVVGGHAYMSRRVRRRLEPVGALLAKKMTPGHWLVRLDQASAAYRHHLPTIYSAVALSLPTHLAQMVAVGLAGQALGMSIPLLLLVAVLPVVFFVGCIPISYQGLGVMEALAITLLVMPAALGTEPTPVAALAMGPEMVSTATTNQVVGMLLLARLYIVCYALLGAAVMLRGEIHLFSQKAIEAVAEA